MLGVEPLLQIINEFVEHRGWATDVHCQVGVQWHQGTLQQTIAVRIKKKIVVNFCSQVMVYINVTAFSRSMELIQSNMFLRQIRFLSNQQSLTVTVSLLTN